MTKRAPWLLLALLMATVPAAAEPSSGTTPEYAIDAERAVVRGDLVSLKSIRDVLLAKLEAGGNADLRYGVAYLGWRMGRLLHQQGGGEFKQILEDSVRHLDTLIEEGGGGAEIWALRGILIGEQVTGAFSGMFLGPQAGKSVKRAMDLEPDNPRVALQRGIGWFFSPKTFGGGVENSERELRRAKTLFAGEPAGKGWPNWGRVDVLIWLGRVLVRTGQYEEARSLYQEALALEPEYAWITSTLLPELEKKAPVPGNDLEGTDPGRPR